MPTPLRMLDIYRFFRFSAMGASAVLPALGAASAGRVALPEALRLIGAACAFHAFAYVDNDVCDLAIDRTQPLRAAYPLVRGAVSPTVARIIAWACAGLALTIRRVGHRDGGRGGRGDRGARKAEAFDHQATAADADDRARRPCVTSWPILGECFGPARPLLPSAILLMALYNRYGKRCPLPPLTDALQGLSWALLIYDGALSAGRPPTRLTHLLAAYELLLIMLVNGVHGALRDLENDAAHGARTTALWLMGRQGTRGQGDGGTRGQGPPSRAGAASDAVASRCGSFARFRLFRDPNALLLAYALALQAAMLALAAHAAAANPAGLPQAQRDQAALGVGLTGAATLALLARAARGGAPSASVGMLHLILILSTPVALVAPGIDPAPRAALLLAHTLPLLANGMTYDALRWLAGGMKDEG